MVSSDSRRQKKPSVSRGMITKSNFRFAAFSSSGVQSRWIATSCGSWPMAYSSDGICSFPPVPETDLNFRRPILSFYPSTRYEENRMERSEVDNESYDTSP